MNSYTYFRLIYVYSCHCQRYMIFENRFLFGIWEIYWVFPNYVNFFTTKKTSLICGRARLHSGKIKYTKVEHKCFYSVAVSSSLINSLIWIIIFGATATRNESKNKANYTQQEVPLQRTRCIFPAKLCFSGIFPLWLRTET